MQLLATTYSNIWPFLDRTITVVFQKGKYLIKAPIGSGKSFMFFDGPVFWLYKYSGRTMLSIKAKEGYIKALFEAGDNIWLVIRALSRTKSGGDSVKSKLFQVNADGSAVQQALYWLGGIVNEESDLEDMLRSKWIWLEEVVFKNETDLQQNLSDFLPPREVYTSTTFLMQDSENMFEMTPAERIDVFKNIFGLLNIDEAKDVISDAKKETTALLKSKRNTDDVNAKLQRLVNDYINIVSANNEWVSDEIISHANDWEMVKEKLSIENFDIASLPLSGRQTLAVSYDQQRSHYQSLLGQLQALDKQHKTASDEIETLLRQKAAAAKSIDELEKKLKTDHTEIIKKLQSDKKDLSSKQEMLAASMPLQELGLSSVYDLNGYISELTQKWKMLKQTKEILEQKVQLVHKQLEDLAERKKSISEQLALIAEAREKQVFICDLIGDKPCPYVDLINKASAKNTDRQEEILRKEEAQLDASKIEAERVKVLQELKLAENDYENAIQEYKKFDFKKIKEDIEIYSSYDKQRQVVDKELQGYEKEKEQHEEYKQELVQLQTKLSHYDESVASLQKQLSELDNERTKLRADTDINQLDKIEAILASAARAMKLLETINDLVAAHKNNMIIIKQLEERETMLGQLFNIFSKEIMIHVLQQTLPLFADVLNNLLAKVVDYTVIFETKNVSDKVELEIKVVDAKWERLVKSLSGWQKTVLRLTRTLAICIFTRSNALFLDETVNNIDRDTIGKVADLIEDFTKTHDITFYIITHSEAIQEMEIRDKVITL